MSSSNKPTAGFDKPLNDYKVSELKLGNIAFFWSCDTAVIQSFITFFNDIGILFANNRNNRGFLRERGLKVSGRKTEIIARLKKAIAKGL